VGPGSVAALSYGFRIPAAISGLLIASISITSLSYFSDMLSKQGIVACRKLYIEVLAFSFLIGVVVAFLGVALAQDIAQFLYMHGKLGSNDAEVIASVMKNYFYQLPFLLVAIVSVRALTAVGKMHLLTGVALMQLLLVSIIGYILSLKYGVSGVALGSSIGATLGSAFLISLSFMVLRAKQDIAAL
jgi:putative peptidoglycan lipid II flippase